MFWVPEPEKKTARLLSVKVPALLKSPARYKSPLDPFRTKLVKLLIVSFPPKAWLVAATFILQVPAAIVTLKGTPEPGVVEVPADHSVPGLYDAL